MLKSIPISEYQYNLPEERIAKFPLAKREESKLLLFDGAQIHDKNFVDAPNLIPANSQLVFNNTKVVQARLLFEKTKGAKPIEIFCLEPEKMEVESAMAAKGEVTIVCLVGNAKRFKDGLILKKNIVINGEQFELNAEKLGRKNDAFIIQFSWQPADVSFAEILEFAGKVPLPPYLNRQSEPDDKKRYQTVYAKHNGSVAAPTAGLHFTDNILGKIKGNNVEVLETTLHVGAGTFKPVSAEDARQHSMHAEEIHVTKSFLQQLLAHRGKRYCVGTTSARTLESLYWLGVKQYSNPSETLVLAQWDAYELPQNVPAEDALKALIERMEANDQNDFFTHTQLMIAPGYQFRMIDGLFTNFHQPGSTLMLLVAAAVGEKWREIYTHALDNNYRFLSYGDSSFLMLCDEAKQMRS